ncbi:hypothetical protein LTR37_001136 [Vermiconidia calcicola]|uniref:Uncharacterized protein n=1 Tax=Vermiconidia calcicola TaxID=1690605 RepID=A0ACC3NWS5_9PEZI|nr:hypothetical protein LTR37_001136 [Vermiconidia calcicola]
MARITIMAVLSLATLLPAALGLPVDFSEAPAEYPDAPVHSPKPPYGNAWTSTVAAYPTASSSARGTDTGSGYPVPTASYVDKREVEAVALNKRAAFEGPRGHKFPHYYPASSPYGSVVPSSTGAAYPSGTGAPSSSSSAYVARVPSSPGAPYPSGTGAPSATGTGSVAPYPTAPASSSSSWQEPYPTSYA